MESQPLRRKLKKRDFFFLGFFILMAVLLFLWFQFGYQKTGSMVEITVDGELYGTYPLDSSQEIPIVVEGKTTNLLLIKNGKADMTEADCPDKLCVHQSDISHVGEMIVCLPNKVVITITGEETQQLDAVVQ